LLSVAKVEKLHVLEELGEHGIAILLYLHRRGREYKRALQTNLRIGAVPFYRALSTLYKYGLVTEVREFPRIYVTLTERGRQLAAVLWQAEELLRRWKGA